MSNQVSHVMLLNEYKVKALEAVTSRGLNLRRVGKIT